MTARRSLVAALGALVVALAALATAPEVRAEEHEPDWAAEEWVFGGSIFNLRHGQSVRLDNLSESYLVYAEREYGINLNWRGTSAAEWTVLIPDGRPGQDHLHYTERFALYNESIGLYLKYGSREYGINLVWGTQPAYEWSIRGQGWTHPVNGGSEVAGEDHVALFNHTAGEFVVQGEREYGIDLVWMDTITGNYS